MTDLRYLLEELLDWVKLQKMPIQLSEDDLEIRMSDILVLAVRTLFIRTGRGEAFRRDMFTYKYEVVQSMQGTLSADEEALVIVYAKMETLRWIQGDVNTIVGYTTNALTVTNADKPFVNLETMLKDLEQREAMIFLSMLRYSHM